MRRPTGATPTRMRVQSGNRSTIFFHARIPFEANHAVNSLRESACINHAGSNNAGA